jgi:hypothetical protein
MTDPRPNVRRIKCEPDQVRVYRESLALSATLARFLPLISGFAWELAGDDEPLQDALLQAARVKIWYLDPSRFAPEDDIYLWVSIKGAMRNEARQWRGFDHTPIELVIEDRLEAERLHRRWQAIEEAA